MVNFCWGPILQAKPGARKAWCESDREEGLESGLARARREKLVAREFSASSCSGRDALGMRSGDVTAGAPWFEGPEPRALAQ